MKIDGLPEPSVYPPMPKVPPPKSAGTSDVLALKEALRLLIHAYVNTLEGDRDRILSLGGTCDDVPTMKAGDPALCFAKRVLAAADGEVNAKS